MLLLKKHKAASSLLASAAVRVLTATWKFPGNARIDKVTGGDYGAGIGSGLGESGAPCNGKVTIKDNAKIGLAQGGFGAAGIGGGYYYSNGYDDDDSTSGVGDVTIEGNTTVNAVGGLGAAGIGNGVNAIDFGGAAVNQITIRSSEAGSPTVTGHRRRIGL